MVRCLSNGTTQNAYSLTVNDQTDLNGRNAQNLAIKFLKYSNVTDEVMEG